MERIKFGVTLKLYLLSAIGCLLGPLMGQVHGELKFDYIETTATLAVDQQEDTVVFRFKNTSDRAVEVLEVKTECDCVRATAVPSNIAAGSWGEVTVQFYARIRHGEELIRVTLNTDAGESYPLSINARLRSYIETSPRYLSWQKNEPREPKEITVSSTGLGRLSFERVRATSKVRTELLPGDVPGLIRVRVFPPDNQQPFRGLILVVTTLEETGETRVYDLRAHGE